MSTGTETTQAFEAWEMEFDKKFKYNKTTCGHRMLYKVHPSGQMQIATNENVKEFIRAIRATGEVRGVTANAPPAPAPEQGFDATAREWADRMLWPEDQVPSRHGVDMPRAILGPLCLTKGSGGEAFEVRQGGGKNNTNVRKVLHGYIATALTAAYARGREDAERETADLLIPTIPGKVMYVLTRAVECPYLTGCNDCRMNLREALGVAKEVEGKCQSCGGGGKGPAPENDEDPPCPTCAGTGLSDKVMRDADTIAADAGAGLPSPEEVAEETRIDRARIAIDAIVADAIRADRARRSPPAPETPRNPAGLYHATNTPGYVEKGWWIGPFTTEQGAREYGAPASSPPAPAQGKDGAEQEKCCAWQGTDECYCLRSKPATRAAETVRERAERVVQRLYTLDRLPSIDIVAAELTAVADEVRDEVRWEENDKWGGRMIVLNDLLRKYMPGSRP